MKEVSRENDSISTTPLKLEFSHTFFLFFLSKTSSVIHAKMESKEAKTSAISPPNLHDGALDEKIEPQNDLSVTQESDNETNGERTRKRESSSSSSERKEKDHSG